MKTIAISIDEATLKALDRWVRQAGRRGEVRKGGGRSEAVRQALREFLARQAEQERDAAEWEVWKVHLDMINRQAGAAMDEQAEP
jgi:metal-responsive CopG/Arc/MetJ family transcriptional regulator